MRDSRGFLWICTRDGLSRFDGSRFITYQIGDHAPGVEQIVETRTGIYWIVTTAGTYRFNPALPSRDASANQDRPMLNAEFVTTFRGVITQDHAGSLWATGDGQILRGVAETAAAFNKFLTEGTVSILYFGFQRRDPDAIGYQNNVNTLNADPNNLRHMIYIFIYSAEYRARFGPQ